MKLYSNALFCFKHYLRLTEGVFIPGVNNHPLIDTAMILRDTIQMGVFLHNLLVRQNRSETGKATAQNVVLSYSVIR